MTPPGKTLTPKQESAARLASLERELVNPSGCNRAEPSALLSGFLTYAEAERDRLRGDLEEP